MLMTNGIGATVGTLAAQAVVNVFCKWTDVTIGSQTKSMLIGDWSSVWYIFAGYALVVALLFAILFKNKYTMKEETQK